MAEGLEIATGITDEVLEGMFRPPQEGQIGPDVLLAARILALTDPALADKITTRMAKNSAAVLAKDKRLQTMNPRAYIAEMKLKQAVADAKAKATLDTSVQAALAAERQ